MNWIVPEKFLKKYKLFSQTYAYHKRWCNNHVENMGSIHDFCNCGYSQMIRELNELELEIEKHETDK